jgi:Bacteroidetes VLRF1 release factor
VSESDSNRSPFTWRETSEILGAAWRRGRVEFDRASRSFIAHDPAGAVEARIALPPCFVPPTENLDVARYLDSLPDRLGRVAIVLVHAGATALGLFDDDSDWIAHKVIKEYVVRGHGKAQPLHRKTKGKSRYGSRLRLQGFETQLSKTNEKLGEWWSAFGPFDRVFRHVPPRIAPELDAAEPAPPWSRDFIPAPIPFHVHVPDFAELKRVRWKLTHGEIVRDSST